MGVAPMLKHTVFMFCRGVPARFFLHALVVCTLVWGGGAQVAFSYASSGVVMLFCKCFYLFGALAVVVVVVVVVVSRSSSSSSSSSSRSAGSSSVSSSASSLK